MFFKVSNLSFFSIIISPKHPVEDLAFLITIPFIINGLIVLLREELQSKPQPLRKIKEPHIIKDIFA